MTDNRPKISNNGWQDGELEKFFAEAFPHFPIQIVDSSPERTVLKYIPNDLDLREGGTILGPTMFALADSACYATFLFNIGREMGIVTTSLSIQFISRPPLQNLICVATPDKIGRRLCFARFEIHSEDGGKTFSNGVCTYARE